MTLFVLPSDGSKIVNAGDMTCCSEKRKSKKSACSPSPSQSWHTKSCSFPPPSQNPSRPSQIFSDPLRNQHALVNNESFDLHSRLRGRQEQFHLVAFLFSGPPRTSTGNRSLRSPREQLPTWPNFAHVQKVWYPPAPTVPTGPTVLLVSLW